MIGTEEQDSFVDKNRWAVVTTLRSDGSPTSSVIFYARDGDDLIFSTTADRLKAKTLRRDPRIAVTVLTRGRRTASSRSRALRGLRSVRSCRVTCW